MRYLGRLSAIMNLNVQERKVIIVGTLSLIAAIVSYGLLKSTGTFENQAWSLGGAIVGFLASVYVLNMVYGKRAAGIPEQEIKGSDFLSEETVKILDLRERIQVSPEEKLTQPKSRVVLIDQHQLRKLSDVKEIDFHCATTGYGIEGECLSFPGDYEWKDHTNCSCHPGQDAHLRKQYEIRINISKIQKNATFEVRNMLTFINAYQGEDKEWFHTHADFPTRSITIIVLFSKDKPCKKIKSLVQYSSRKPFKELNHASLTRARNGEVVYFNIKEPVKGAAYQLEWEW